MAAHSERRRKVVQISKLRISKPKIRSWPSNTAASLQRRRVHQQHRDHAAEKHQQHNSQADKYSISNRVILLFLAPERRRIGKIGGGCNRVPPPTLCEQAPL